MANYGGSLEAVDCYIYWDGYDMWLTSLYTILAVFNGPLQAVNFDIHSVGYDLLLKRVLSCAQIGPHQATYEAVAPLIGRKRAFVATNKLLHYRCRL
eukprot:scaffold8008_cov141-Skeletonema_marinoi.AAC.2